MTRDKGYGCLRRKQDVQTPTNTSNSNDEERAGMQRKKLRSSDNLHLQLYSGQDRREANNDKHEAMDKEYIKSLEKKILDLEGKK